MDNTTLFLLILAAIAIGMLIAFRNSLKISLKGFGIDFAASGSNKDSGDSGGKPRGSKEVSPQVVASAERAVAVAETVHGPIITGDQNRTGSSD